jgi:hypothetical protein
LTNENHLAQLSVEEIDPLGPRSIEVAFSTWLNTPEPSEPGNQARVSGDGTDGTATRINFEPGRNEATARDKAVVGQSQAYVLRGLAGQYLSLALSPADGAVVLSARGADGSTLIPERDQATSWSGILPTTQDYYVDVMSTDEDTFFSLTSSFDQDGEIASDLKAETSTIPTPQISGEGGVVRATLSLEPLPAAECKDIAGLVLSATGLDTSLSDAPFRDYRSGQEGTACLALATGTGSDFGDIYGVVEAINRGMTGLGWGEDPEFRADGPTGTNVGFTRAQGICLLGVSWLPAPGIDCGGQPISACNLSPQQKHYTLSLSCAQLSAQSSGSVE